MKKLMLVAVLALLCAAPANAKELLGAQLCGASGCATERQAALFEGQGGPLGGGTAAPPAQAGPWYRGALLLGDRGKVYGRYAFYYVPDGRLVVQPGMDGQTTTWLKAQGALGGLLERLAAKLRPFATPKLADVAINGKLATDPQSYLRLYSIGSKAETYPTDTRSVQIVLETTHRTPWSDGNNLVVYPGSNLLLRDGEIVSIPGDVADRAANGESLDVGGGLPWLVIAAAVAVALLLGAAVFRLRPRIAPRPVPQA
jgi:opacity protein-like surface antigen